MSFQPTSSFPIFKNKIVVLVIPRKYDRQRLSPGRNSEKKKPRCNSKNQNTIMTTEQGSRGRTLRRNLALEIAKIKISKICS